MSERLGGRCMYCGRSMSLNVSGQSHQAARMVTVDHLFPQAGDQSFVLSLSLKRQQLNLVPSCRSCNAMKGMLHPLDWIVIVPDPLGAIRAATRLLDMGVPWVDVQAALARRKRT